MTTARGWRKWSIILICLMPTIIGITIVNLIPMGYNFRISFTDTDRGIHNGQYNKSLDQMNTVDDVGLQSSANSKADGILEIILQSANVYDHLASRWSTTYRSHYEPFREWVESVKEHRL